MVRSVTVDYWNAARAYHAATDSKQKWAAMLDLMKVALSGKTRVAERARKMLADEGLLVHPGLPLAVKGVETRS